MPKTEHAAPSAKELREAAQELIAALLQMRHIENMSEDEFPLAARRKLEALLASGPCKEERLILRWFRTRDGAIRANAKGLDNFNHGESEDALCAHARSLRPEQGKEAGE